MLKVILIVLLVLLILSPILLVFIAFQWVLPEDEAAVTVSQPRVARQQVIRESDGIDALYFVLYGAPRIGFAQAYRVRPIPTDIKLPITRLEIRNTMRLGTKVPTIYIIDGQAIPAGSVQQLGVASFNLDTRMLDLLPKGYKIP